MNEDLGSLLNEIKSMNINLSRLFSSIPPSSGSWQMDYLKHNWQYVVYRSKNLPGGVQIAQMGQTIQILREPVYGLLHAVYVNVTGSKDLINAQAYVADTSQGGLQNAVFRTTPQDAMMGSVVQPAVGSPFLAEYNDSSKSYTAVYSPAEPIPMHNIVISLILPTPMIEPEVTEVAISYDVLVSQMLQVQGKTYIDANGNIQTR